MFNFTFLIFHSLVHEMLTISWLTSFRLCPLIYQWIVVSHHICCHMSPAANLPPSPPDLDLIRLLLRLSSSPNTNVSFISDPSTTDVMGYPVVCRLFMQQSCSIHVPSTLDITQEHNRRRLRTCLNIDAACTRSQNISLLEVHCSNHVTRSICYHNNVVPYFVNLVSCAPLADGFILPDPAMFVPSPYKIHTPMWNSTTA